MASKLMVEVWDVHVRRNKRRFEETKEGAQFVSNSSKPLNHKEKLPPKRKNGQSQTSEKTKNHTNLPCFECRISVLTLHSTFIQVCVYFPLFLCTFILPIFHFFLIIFHLIFLFFFIIFHLIFLFFIIFRHFFFFYHNSPHFSHLSLRHA